MKPDQRPTLPFTEFRCIGLPFDKSEWVQQCGRCLRRTSPGKPENQAYNAQPKLTNGECKDRIAE